MTKKPMRYEIFLKITDKTTGHAFDYGTDVHDQDDISQAVHELLKFYWAKTKPQSDNFSAKS